MSIVALSVMLLLEVVGSAPEGVRSHAEVKVLSIKADFDCGRRETQVLAVPPGAEVVVSVPHGCPDEGTLWLLSLRCTSRCSGRVLDAQGTALARVEGPRTKLAVGPERKANSPALRLLRLSVGAGTDTADASDLLDVPLVLNFKSTAFASSLMLEVAEASSLPSPDFRSKALLHARASRIDLDRARVEVWNDQRQLLVSRVVKLGEAFAFDCAPTAGWCTGEALLSVRPHQLRSRP